MTTLLPDKEWRNLLRAIRNRQVVPVVGPELVTIADPDSGDQVNLYEYLAPRLAKELGFDKPEEYRTINRVACESILKRISRGDFYDEIRSLMESLKGSTPNEALLKLASIDSFNLFISGTFDDQLVSALAASRPDFDPSSQTIDFHPTRAKDVPKIDAMPPTAVCHILGHYDTYPDFAVWEEDYMEYICGLLDCRDQLTNLFLLLKNQHLLFLGAPANDWILRFFLRIARQQRLSESRSGGVEYLADESAKLETPMIFYFDRMIQTTRVVDGSPISFVNELAERWEDEQGESKVDKEFLKRIPDQLPNRSVFISYASEDQKHALAIARSLYAKGIPVWLDKVRLKSGDFEQSLKFAIERLCSFFVSVVSDVTENPANAERYVHTERVWASVRHDSHYEFYFPVVVSESVQTLQREPECFRTQNFVRLNDGKLPEPWLTRLAKLHEVYVDHGPPVIGQF
jgi:hypothetical protein